MSVLCKEGLSVSTRASSQRVPGKYALLSKDWIQMASKDIEVYGNDCSFDLKKIIL